MASPTGSAHFCCHPVAGNAANVQLTLLSTQNVGEQVEGPGAEMGEREAQTLRAVLRFCRGDWVLTARVGL